MRGTWKRIVGRFAPILVIGAVGILVAAPTASGQAALDQYVPKGDPAGGSHDAGSLDNPIVVQFPNEGTGHKAASHKSGSDKGGRLPLIDYPGTPFLWIVVAILVAGALIRIAISVKKRTGALGTS
jgi:hypothetical protein